MGLITMTEEELKRLRVIQDLVSREITPRHAAQLLRNNDTPGFEACGHRFSSRFGPAGLVSRHRGRPSNRAIPRSLTRKAKRWRLFVARYSDFGPTFAAQKLSEKHALRLSAGTIRDMDEARWAVDRSESSPTVHPPAVARAASATGNWFRLMDLEHYWSLRIVGRVAPSCSCSSTTPRASSCS